MYEFPLSLYEKGGENLEGWRNCCNFACLLKKSRWNRGGESRPELFEKRPQFNFSL